MTNQLTPSQRAFLNEVYKLPALVDAKNRVYLQNTEPVNWGLVFGTRREISQNNSGFCLVNNHFARNTAINWDWVPDIHRTRACELPSGQEINRIFIQALDNRTAVDIFLTIPNIRYGFREQHLYLVAAIENVDWILRKHGSGADFVRSLIDETRIGDYVLACEKTGVFVSGQLTEDGSVLIPKIVLDERYAA